ncbi:MAG TPA: beta-eliminating lyase-related protein, partial [Anaerolineaceae bacterium]
NAAVALGVPVSQVVAGADSVTFCLSKGLCAPVGSVLCGSREFINRTVRIRKQLGGGMRQAGILAAAGIVALEQMVDRLAEDHRRACDLARGLAQVPGLKLTFGMPATNMVFVSLADDVPGTAWDLCLRLEPLGVLCHDVNQRAIRLVTHYWISDEGVQQTIRAFAAAL